MRTLLDTELPYLSRAVTWNVCVEDGCTYNSVNPPGANCSKDCVTPSTVSR